MILQATRKMRRKYGKLKPELYARKGPSKATWRQPSVNAWQRHSPWPVRVLLALSFFVALNTTVDTMLGLHKTGQARNLSISASAAVNPDIGGEIADSKNKLSYRPKMPPLTLSGSDGNVPSGSVNVEDSNQVNWGYDMDFYIDNYYDYEQGNDEPIVKGRLKAAIDFWRSIGSNPVVLDILYNGYKLPFLSTPGPKMHKNNKSALEHSVFVSEAISDLLEKGLVCHCTNTPAIVNPLSVAVQKSGKKRLILDLRYINKFLWKNKVKFDDWKVASSFLEKGDFMFSFDLKSSYHHIDIYHEHCKYLSFAWNSGNCTEYFSFLVLPFGLSTAPYLFTKCLRPLVKHWRNQGYFVVVYLDDGWGRAGSKDLCNKIAKKVKADLLSAGFVPNIDKSVWTPTQKLSWLGLTWNSEIGSLMITDNRIQDILQTLDEAQKKITFCLCSTTSVCYRQNNFTWARSWKHFPTQNEISAFGNREKDTLGPSIHD